MLLTTLDHQPGPTEKSELGGLIALSIQKGRINPVTAIATGLILGQELRMKGIQFTRDKTLG
jgi:hypothetical protein